MAKIKECQDVVGGGIVFLECEKKRMIQNLRISITRMALENIT